MNYILLSCIIIAMLNGIIQGLGDMAAVRRNPDLGIRESKNIFTFLFTDEYK